MAHEPHPEPAGPGSQAPDVAPPAANGPGPEASVPPPFVLEPLPVAGLFVRKAALIAQLRRHWTPSIADVETLPNGYILHLSVPAAVGINGSG